MNDDYNTPPGPDLFGVVAFVLILAAVLLVTHWVRSTPPGDYGATSAYAEP